MPRTPTNNIDYTNKDYESFRQMMIEGLKERIPEYTDLSQTDAGIVLLELNAQGLDILSYYQDVFANEVFLPTERQRENVLKWCKVLSYYPRNASPAKFKQVFVLNGVKDIDTVIPQGTLVKTTRGNDAIYFETMTDLTIPMGKLGDEKEADEYLYTVDVIQGIPISGELLGTSTGVVNQSFTLKYSSVIVDSIEIFINQGAGFEKWVRVDTFVDSNPNSKHYRVEMNDRDQANIIFSDGIFGKIPTVYANGIFANYRTGVGSDGNVAPNTITILDSTIAGVQSTFNPESAFEYGVDKETIEQIKISAPNNFRTQWGALTLKDFSDIVLLNFSDVALANSVRSELDIDDVIIYVMLIGDAPLTENKKAEILSLFDENIGGRKVVGVNEITILPPTYVVTDFNITVVLKDLYSRATVSANIETYLNDFFNKGNYPFNAELSLSELSSNIQKDIEGIKSIKFTIPMEDILIPQPDEIFTCGTVTITASGGIL